MRLGQFLMQLAFSKSKMVYNSSGAQAGLRLQPLSVFLSFGQPGFLPRSPVELGGCTPTLLGRIAWLFEALDRHTINYIAVHSL